MVPIDVPGRALDFSLTGLGTPVVHVRVANIFAELDVQLIPVGIDGCPGQ